MTTPQTSLLASVFPRTERARCPKCGGRLVANVTLRAIVPVELEVLVRSPRVKHTQHILDTKAELEQQIETYAEDDAEVFCEHYRYGSDGCRYWTRVVDLEGR